MFEGAEASVAMLMARQKPDYSPPFELVDFMVVVENRRGRGLFAEATVKVAVHGEELHTVAEGNGPVDALDRALRKALTPVYPQLSAFQLADYKVRILDGQNGTAATTRVLIDTQNGAALEHRRGERQHHRGKLAGMADSVEYGLLLA